ncbi:MAG: 1-acyl-sn-glycerol-3-phosphate acyltransferase [Lachnospiraceae bacterium]|nr:1-acyl-sn-glycerol-3-phosphate acyltransferase [Lachnospiraceae bacterium]
MKIRTVDKSYEDVLKLPKKPHQKPKKQWGFLRWILKPLCFVLLKLSGFTGYKKKGMEKLGKGEPCLVLMNHSSFIDLEIVAFLLGDRAYHIVTTLDAFVGLSWILRLVGCIPTKKFINDVNLVRDMRYTLKELKESVVMYPEASYSFDGTATPLPDSLGKCLKLLGVPVVVIRTEGAFLREPLYNCLQRRKVKLSATMEYLLSPEDIKSKSVEELNEILAESFDFDHFKTQQEKGILVTEPYRADGLHRVLYKCPHCQTEGQTVGKGVHLTCNACGVKYELTESGFLQAVSGETLINHIPDWYRWERECVKKELEAGTYKLDVDVDICMLVDTKCVYRVGSGHLVHTKEGFHLTGCNGLLDYKQSPHSSYGLYSDFYWYEIGDMICVGDEKVQYYCFPKNAGNVVAKTRMAAEELYKMLRKLSKAKREI